LHSHLINHFNPTRVRLKRLERRVVVVLLVDFNPTRVRLKLGQS